MKLHYSIAAKLGDGIGLTAQKQIEGARESGIEVEACTVDILPRALRHPAIKDNQFDTVAALQMQEHDVLHGWSQHSLFQMLLSKGYSRATVLQRSSHHILKQREILEAEFRRRGIQDEPVPALAVKKELLEYEVADRIVVPSESCWKSFDDHGLGDKTRVVGFGVDSHRFTPSESGGNGFTALFLGGNIVRKGLIYAIQAWKALETDGTLLVGGRDDVPYPAPGNVEATGYVDDVRNLYRRADALVLPSLEEGQSLTVWEAMASGLPVVVTDRCGFNEIIRDGEEGYVVPPGNACKLRDALKKLARNPGLREEMGRNARRTAEKHPWSRHQEGLVEVWRNAVN